MSFSIVSYFLKYFTENLIKLLEEKNLDFLDYLLPQPNN